MSDEDPNAALTERFIKMSPEHVFDAVEIGGVRCTGRYMVLNSYENRVFSFELEDETWIVAKFYRPGRWSRETILDEHRFIADLAEAEIPVARPLPHADGTTLGTWEGILFAVFPRVRGRQPQEFNTEEVEVMGRFLARLHNVGAAGEAPHRLRLTPASYGWDNVRYLAETGLIPPEAKANYVQTAEILLKRIEPLFVNVPMQRIHGDCHLGNLIWVAQGPAFLDFDDMLIGPVVQDVWMLLPSFDEFGVRDRERFIDAYEQFREFDHAQLRLIEPLRALRYLHYTAWIARRWEDPLFKRVFAHFGTLRYWQQETNDLREQIARIDYQPTW